MPRLRDRLPALFVTASFHVVVVGLLLIAMPKQFAREEEKEQETQITLLPQAEPEQPKEKRKPRSGTTGSNAITAPYFDPNRFNSQTLQALAPPQRLSFALEACAPEKYDMASDEIRMACARIGSLIARDPGRFGVTTDFKNGQRWERELLINQTPLLLPCMSSNANVLYTLLCVYDTMMNGYDPDKMQHYSK